MFPCRSGKGLEAVRFPRASGDVPHIGRATEQPVKFSPRERGCSATSKISATLRWFSPRERGCSDRCDLPRLEPVVFPARAGMFRACGTSVSVSMSFPRASGDVPSRGLEPAGGREFSPRERGCSSHHPHYSHAAYVFPARAGMFRLQSPKAKQDSCFPRASGDVPRHHSRRMPQTWFSPRERGCSLRSPTGNHQPFVFPARAGMFRKRSALARRLACFPRASGDVPNMVNEALTVTLFSPRERGCSH